MKRRLLKNSIVFALCLVLAAGLVSCGPAGNTSNTQGGNASYSQSGNTSGNSSGSNVQSPGSIEIAGSPAFSYEPPVTVEPVYCVLENPLTIENNYTDSIDKPLRVSGLKDSAVQDRINSAILAEMERICDPEYLPNGRGIKLLEKQYSGSAKRSVISVYTMYNCGNLLSVLFNYTKYYGGYAPVDYEVQDKAALTFDLSTGEQLKLQDLFIDGVDAKKYVDSIIFERAMAADPALEPVRNDDIFSEESYYYVRLFPQMVSEFSGIADDQPFYIQDKGILCVILDYRNTEFYIREGSYEVRIPYGEVDAASERFEGDKGLYTKAPGSYHFVSLAEGDLAIFE